MKRRQAASGYCPSPLTNSAFTQLCQSWVVRRYFSSIDDARAMASSAAAHVEAGDTPATSRVSTSSDHEVKKSSCARSKATQNLSAERVYVSAGLNSGGAIAAISSNSRT